MCALRYRFCCASGRGSKCGMTVRGGWFEIIFKVMINFPSLDFLQFFFFYLFQISLILNWNMICCMMTQFWKSKIWQCFQRKMRLSSERCCLCGWKALSGLLLCFLTRWQRFLMYSKQVPTSLAVAQHCADMQWLSSAESLLTEELKQSWEVKVEPQKGKMVTKYASSVAHWIFSEMLREYWPIVLSICFSYVHLKCKQALKSCCLPTDCQQIISRLMRWAWSCWFVVPWFMCLDETSQIFSKHLQGIVLLFCNL